MLLSNSQTLSSLFSTEEFEIAVGGIHPPIQINFSDGLWLIAGGYCQIKLSRKLTDEEFSFIRKAWMNRLEKFKSLRNNPSEYQEFLIKSRKTSQHYKVFVDNDKWKCECQGFGWRGVCWHIDEAKKIKSLQ